MKVVVVGAGSVGASIVRELCGHGHDVVVIDETPDAIGRSDLQNSHWIVGDACDPTVLREAELERMDVVVTATGDDKVNLVVSLMARSEFGVPRTVGRVNNPKNEWMFDQAWGVDVAVSTPRLITALVEEAVEVGDVVRLLNLQSDRATLNAFTVPHGHAVIATTVGEIPWPPDATLVAILRDGSPVAPTRDDVIEAEDELFFLATGDGESELQALFARGSEG